MAGLVPAIHVFDLADAVKTWMPGTGPGMTERVVQFGQVMLYTVAPRALARHAARHHIVAPRALARRRCSSSRGMISTKLHGR